jgi:hypothetical protein
VDCDPPHKKAERGWFGKRVTHSSGRFCQPHWSYPQLLLARAGGSAVTAAVLASPLGIVSRVKPDNEGLLEHSGLLLTGRGAGHWKTRPGQAHHTYGEAHLFSPPLWCSCVEAKARADEPGEQFSKRSLTILYFHPAFLAFRGPSMLSFIRLMRPRPMPLASFAVRPWRDSRFNPLATRNLHPLLSSPCRTTP